MFDHKLACILNADFMLNRNISEYLLRSRDRFQVIPESRNAHYLISLNEYPLGENSPCYNKRNSVFRKLKKILADFQIPDYITVFMHGSFATGDITAFSDIDIAIFIDSEKLTFDDIRATQSVVKGLRKYMYSIDPIMHHGIDFIDKKCFPAYDESSLPINTLENSVRLWGKNACMTISVDRQLSMQNARDKLVKYCNALLSYDESCINLTPYRMKCIMSVLFLIPVLLLQADKGIFLYKKIALSKSMNEYKKLNFSAIDTATQLRECWKTSYTSLAIRKILFLLYPFIPNLASGQRLAGCFYPFSRKKSFKFIREAKSLARQVIEYVKA
jgi:predicted nucleotidyltransferase